MRNDTKLPAWLARRGYSARLKRRIARARSDRTSAETAAEPEGPAPGGNVLPFPTYGFRRAPAA